VQDSGDNAATVPGDRLIGGGEGPNHVSVLEFGVVVRKLWCASPRYKGGRGRDRSQDSIVSDERRLNRRWMTSEG
jgi:hypothetical protein